MSDKLRHLKKLSTVRSGKNIKFLTPAVYSGGWCPMRVACNIVEDIEGLSYLMVGMPECATHSRGMNSMPEGENGELRWLYVLDANEVIFGCRKGVIEALKEMDEAGAKAILMIATCVTDLIGEDFESIISEVQPKMNARLSYVNLVIRREGIPAAKVLQKKFGTPYVYARPYGIKGTTDWLYSVGEAFGTDPDAEFIAYEENLWKLQYEPGRYTLENNQWSYPDEAVLTIGGHYDVVKGILNFATTELPISKGTAWCNCPEMGDEEIPYFSEKEWIPVVKNHEKGYLMFSGEALKWAGKNTQLQIANPDITYRMHPYDPPFVGYRGAINIVNKILNEYVLKH